MKEKSKLSMKKFRWELYHETLLTSQEVDVRNKCDYRVNLRLPKKVSEALKNDLKALHKEAGMKLSQNDYIVHILLHYTNMKQTPNQTITRKQDGLGFHNYIETEKKTWITYLKEKWFFKRT